MDCLTPTQRTPIPHGQSLTIEDVLPLTGGGYFGAESQGFCDAAEDSLPMELRPKEEQRKLQQMESTAAGSEAWTETTQKADEENLMFLEAQAMATLKEIKLNLKRRKSLADAAWKAKQDAEKAASKKSATTTRSTSSDGGKGEPHGKTTPTSPKKSERTVKRHVRDVKPSFGSRTKSVVGHWGKKNAVLDPINGDKPSSQGETASAGGVASVESYDEQAGAIPKKRSVKSSPASENSYDGAVMYDALMSDDDVNMEPIENHAHWSTFDSYSAYYADAPLGPAQTATEDDYSHHMSSSL